MDKLRELQEQRLQFAAQIKELGNRQDKWTDEDRAAWSTLNDQYNNVLKSIEDETQRNQAAAAVNARVAEIEASLRANNQTMHGDEGRRTETTPELSFRAAEKDRAIGLQAWLRHANGKELHQDHLAACQRIGFNPRQPGYDLELREDVYANTEPGWTHRGRPLQRNLNVGTPSAGGTTIPEGFMTNLERALLAFGSPRGVCQVIRTASGNDLPWPTVDDTSNTGELLGEQASIGTSVDPTFGAKVFGAYKYSSKPILISAELLEDSAFNLAQLIGSLLGERLGRITGTHFTTGTNAAQPHGIVTAAAAATLSSGVAYTASATAITADEIIDLIHSVDPAYRQNATGFMCHDKVMLYVRKLKQGTADYLWQPGMTVGEPDRLLGYPMAINQAMASSIAASARTMLFGDFSKFIIRDVAGLRMYRLEELYRANDRTGFVCFSRHDSDCIQPNAIRALVQHA